MSLPLTPQPASGTEPTDTQHTWRLWVVFPVLWLTALMVSLEATVVSTALPVINAELGTGDDFIWVLNVFFLTNAAFQPFLGQLANAVGRRYVMMASIVLFLLGSAVAGSSASSKQLIAGRAMQGAGSGGVTMLLDLIVSDLVPVRSRPGYIAATFVAVNIGTALGPFLGGVIVERVSWRWIFYINLPVAGIALVAVTFCLDVGFNRELMRERILSIDYVGNCMLIASTTSVLFAISYGDIRYSWSSWHAILPLVIGLSGFGIFSVYEAFVPRLPIAPRRFFSRRTSAAGYLITFFWSILSFWRIYFLSVYFQAVQLSSPSRAGVQVLPSVIMLIPAVVVGAWVTKKTGKYRTVHFVSLAGLLLGHGLYILLSPSSTAVEWILFQLVTGLFGNMLIPAILPAIQAGLEETDAAAATAFWGFVRSFGIIWGITIPAAVLNARFDSLAYHISDPTLRAGLTGGKAYEKASASFIKAITGSARDELVGVYAGALTRVWEVAMIFPSLALIFVFLERKIDMRTTINSEFGLKEVEKG